MAKEGRYPQFTQITGEPGCGKTTLMVNLLKKKIAKGDRVMVIDPDGQEESWFDYPRFETLNDVPNSFSGMIVLEYYDDLFDELLSRMKSGELKDFNLVLDDANFYSASRPPESLKKILMRKRQYECDIWSVAHGFSTVPPFFFAYITQHILFNTADEAPNRKAVIQGYEVFIAKIRHVQKWSKEMNNKHYCVALDRFGNFLKKQHTA